MTRSEWDSPNNKRHRTLVRMLIPKFSDQDDLIRERSRKGATMDRKDAQSSQQAARRGARARNQESAEERTEVLADLMMEDLGVARASHITAADSVRNSLPVNPIALENSRAFRRPGTQEYAAAQAIAGQLSAWRTAYTELENDGADDHKEVLHDGQGHRAEMARRLQQAGPFRGAHGGGQGGRARGSGRGGGVMGTRGRGDRMVSSSHQQSALQNPSRHANRSNIASNTLTVPTATDRRAASSSPRHRAGPRGSDSPRGRADRKPASSTYAGPSNSNRSIGKELPQPVERASNPTPRMRRIDAVADRTTNDHQTQVRPTVRLPPTRPPRGSLNLANPSVFMEAMNHLRGSNTRAAASGMTEVRVEGASTVTVTETAKSTVTRSSGSISIKTVGNDRETTAEPEIIFSREIDEAPVGLRVPTPPPPGGPSQQSTSSGSYSDDLMGLQFEVPHSVEEEKEPEVEKRTEAEVKYDSFLASSDPSDYDVRSDLERSRRPSEDSHVHASEEAYLNSSEQARSTPDESTTLANAQTLLGTLRGLSRMSSLPPSLATAIADLEAWIGNLHETRATELARSGAETARPVDDSSTAVQAGDIDRAAAGSNSNTQGSGNHASSPRKSSSDSVASQPGVPVSSHRSFTLSQSGSISSRVLRLQDQWASGVMAGLREVLPITTDDLDQSLHHDPSGTYRGRASTRTRLPTTNLGEHLLPIGSRNEQTAPLSPPSITLTQDVADRNTVFRDQIPTSSLQPSRSSNPLGADFFTRTMAKINLLDHLPPNSLEMVYGMDDLLFSTPQGGTTQPTSQEITVDALGRTTLPETAPANSFVPSAFMPLAPPTPPFVFSMGSSVSPFLAPARPLRFAPATRAAETASDTLTNIAPPTINTVPSTVSPVATAAALSGGVGASRWSTATSSMVSPFVVPSSTPAIMPTATALSGGVGASRWSTASSGLTSTLVASTGVTAPVPTATALGGGVGVSRWSTATGVNDFIQARRTAALDIGAPATHPTSSVREFGDTTNLPPSTGNPQTLRGGARGPPSISTFIDPGIGDTTPLFSTYIRPQSQRTPNVPSFIIQAQAMQTDPGAAARAQYSVTNTILSNIQEHPPLSPSAAGSSVAESAGSSLIAKRSKDPWDPARRRRL